MWRLVGLFFEAEILKQNMPVAKERVYYLSVREVAPRVLLRISLLTELLYFLLTWQVAIKIMS